MSFIADFHLLRPLWLLALLPLPPILWWLIRYPARHSDWERACDSHLLQHLLVPNSTTGHRSGLRLLAAVWLLAVLALSGPSWERYPHTLYQPPEAQVLVLSLDRSMLAEDLNPSRLERARHKIADLLVPGRQAALVVYAGAAFSVAPLTHDSATIRHLLGVLDPGLMPASGSRPEHGLQLAGELLAQAGVSSGHIILLTDQGSAAATATARRLATQNHRVSVLAVGTPGSAPLPATRDGEARQLAPFDETGLHAIARAGGGIYTRLLADNRDVQALLAATPGSERRSDGDESTALRWLDRGPWLVVLLLPLAALGFRRGWLSVLLVAALLPPPAQARSWNVPSWDDLWWRSDQQDYRHQEGLYGDWQRAEQAYRTGDFATAAEAFAKLPGALGHYNHGNALVGLGELHAALAAYDAALALDPDFTAARENRARVLEQLQQQSAEAPSDPENGDGTGEAAATGEASGGDQPDDNGEDGDGERDPSTAGAGEEGTQADPDARTAGEDSAAGRLDGSTTAEAADPWERQQAMEQRLRRVPDDPGGLLRRKFLYQYRERHDG